MQLKTVLALTDLEEDSLAGLRTAQALAEASRAQLVVGHVLVPRTLDPGNVRDFLLRHGFDPEAVTVEIEVDADVLSGIDLLVEQSSPDLVVLSSARARGAARLFTASIAVALAGRASVPVLALHADTEPGRFRRALVCVDGSPFGQTLLDWTSGLLDPEGEVVALMVIEDSPLVIGGVDIGLFNDEVLRQADEAAARYLRGLRVARPDLRLRVDHRVGNAVEEICRARTEHDCDLVVIGTGGVGGEAWFVLGKVAQGVLRHAETPMLIVPTETAS